MSSSDLLGRLRKAQKSVKCWLSSAAAGSGGSATAAVAATTSGKRISTPQLVKRTVHVTYDRGTGCYRGVPHRWQSEFEKIASGSDVLASQPTKAPELNGAPLHGEDDDVFDKASADTTTAPSEGEAHTVTVAIMPSANGPSGLQRPVWFDQCSRKFVNLPQHWHDRMQRNNLCDWTEFQRNPQLLTTVFTLMDEELMRMDLSSLGLDSSFCSSSPEGSSNSLSNSGQVGSHQHSQHSAELHHQSASMAPSPETLPASGTNGRPKPGAIVWTQQRSFVKDDESDSEEFAEL